MELNDLKALMAASLVGGNIEEKSLGHVRVPSRGEIEAAVATAQEIWEEVLRQDRL